MGATLSKLWGAVRTALTGGTNSSSSTSNDNTGNQPKDVENGLSTTDTPAKPPTPLPNMSGIKKYEITEPWIRDNCALGEGPFWEEKTNSLRFLDIEKCELHTVDLSTGPSSHKTIKMDISMGSTADVEGNDHEFIFGGKYGYGIANRDTGAYRWIKQVWTDEEVAAGKPDRMRGNDGAVDSQGRFWVGFMNDPMVPGFSDFQPEGALFRLDPDGTLHRALDKIKIPNGTTWNKTDNTMYWADSPFRTIYQFDYDPATASITNKRPFFTMPDDKRYGEDAVPDGHCLDEEGYMWTALHGGSRVLRISPEGEVVAEIKVPTLQPTCPCFCGDDLIITSAGGTSGEGGKGVDEFAGSVFKINVGVRGLKKFRFKGGVAVEGGKVDGKIVGE
ncbi:SGL-domain-containing protein [Aaosphaeria arxii CBS 175.79]|uniref:SGL-domain-containing protein n=1 Tax=Aaosphaeria arxii CBS 175.79 TaxID=1450172 RepID=A0A6A5Y6K1_9PLEO|nr:SGL-domain-containing protein [Aaosphaeria arxii CBS 175.79]KAF2020371.1 SGL-domain-containing protein [Aaosphaeria arxii CBS 175.79]